MTKIPRRNYGGKDFRPMTFNEMPVPEGDFWALHAKRQRKHNLILAIGVASLGFGLTLVS